MCEKYINLIVKNNPINTHTEKFLENYFFATISQTIIESYNSLPNYLPPITTNTSITYRGM